MYGQKIQGNPPLLSCILFNFVRNKSFLVSHKIFKAVQSMGSFAYTKFLKKLKYK